MSFAEPVVNQEGRYVAVFRAGDVAMVEVVLSTNEGAELGDDVDALFQGLVDAVGVSPLFEFSSARKTQKVSSTTEVVPTTLKG